MAKFPITNSLQATVEQNEHIDEVHFTADGNHHFRVFSPEDKKNKNLYSRLHEIHETTPGGIVTAKRILAPIKDRKNNDDEKFLIVETLTREQVLSATPVADKVPSQLVKADVIAAIEGFTTEELQAILKSRKGK